MRTILLSCGLLLVAALIAAATLRAQTQKSPSSTSQKKVERDDESYGPVVDYKVKPDGRQDTSGPDGIEVNSPDTYLDSVPAMPAAESEAVVIGEIVAAQAHQPQPPDKPGVYSEFTVRVEEVLKNNARAQFTPGFVSIVEREGGRLRFPSGRMMKFTPSGQRMPRIGRRYVLFLKDVFQGQGTFIQTAYELQGGRVSPLDALNRFDTFKGMDEALFLTKVREAIANCSPATGKEGQ
jgi:hypothetical protein